jgi:serine protease
MEGTMLKWAVIAGLLFVLGQGPINNAGGGTDAPLFSGEAYVENEILVTFKPGVSKMGKSQAHRRLGAISHQDAYGNSYQVIKVREGMVERMVDRYSRHPLVAHAEPNYIRKACFTPNDPYFSFQWHLSQIKMEEAWDMSTGEGVTVAVVDTGINSDGRDGFGGRLVSGHNTINRANPDGTVDNNGHGTHVAGTIAQQTHNGTGVAGVAYEASIMPIKALNRMGQGTVRSIADGIRWATDHGAEVINMSLAGDYFSWIEKRAVDYAYNRGVVLVASSGNETALEVSYPAAYENCIAVGAIRYDEVIAAYSNGGSALDVVAPGGDATVDQNYDGYPDGVLQETFPLHLFGRSFGWDWYYYEGTSMAAPHVAGVAALIIAENPNYAPDDVRAALINTAKDLGSPGWDELYGFGLVDAAAALRY